MSDNQSQEKRIHNPQPERGEEHRKSTYVKPPTKLPKVTPPPKPPTPKGD